MDVVALGDVLGGTADRDPVLDDLLAGRDVAQGHLVTERHGFVVGHLEGLAVLHPTLDGRPRLDVVHGYSDHVVRGVDEEALPHTDNYNRSQPTCQGTGSRAGPSRVNWSFLTPANV